MTDREDILRMAREAGLFEDGKFFVLEHSELERFFWQAYDAGAAAEREACAKVCEDDVRTWSHPGSVTREECAAAIRARGAQPQTCPDCHGVGYDASGQTCGCQP